MKKLLVLVLLISGSVFGERFNFGQVEEVKPFDDDFGPSLTLSHEGKAFAGAQYFPDDRVVNLHTQDGQIIQHDAQVGVEAAPKGLTTIGYYQDKNPLTGEAYPTKRYVGIDSKALAVTKEELERNKK